MNHRLPLMRPLLLSLLVGALVLPAQAQDSVNQWRTFLEGTWAQDAENPEFVVEIEHAPAADTLYLRLMGSNASPLVHQETIECLLKPTASGQLAIQTCPSLTITRTAPPSETTLRLPPESEAREGLQQLAKTFAGEAARSNESLMVGTNQRYRLVKRDS
jgi:hypothetical protein